jgi:zinc protease
MPALVQGSFETEREAQLAEIKLDDDDVVTQGKRLLRQKFFGEYPLAIDANGDEAGLAALKTGDLRTLHGELLRASNMVLAVSGDFKRSEILPRLKELMQAAPAGKAPGAPSLFRGPDSAEHELVLAREQAVVFQAFPGPTLLAEDFYAGEVADELFSGMASRLFDRVREQKGLAYFVRSSRVTGLGGAMFYFYAGTAPEKTADVLREIELEIERVANGDVEQQELQRCIARLRAGRRQAMQTASSRAFNAALNALFGLPANDWAHYDQRIGAVSISDLAAFASRYLRREKRVQLVVHP